MALEHFVSFAQPACATIVATVLAQLIYQIVYYRYFHPLSKFPGPFWGGVTRIWLALQFYRGVEIETEMKLHAKYGSYTAS